MLSEYILIEMEAVTVRQQQKEQTRRNLIRAAGALFSKKGINATATADVARQLKLSHGTVFVHFPKREDLVLAVIDDFGERLSAELARAIETESEVEGILRAHIRTLAEFEDFYFRLLSEFHFLPGPIRSTVFMLNSAVSWKLFEAATPLMREGKIKNFSRPLLFNTWMALVHYNIVNREQLSDGKSVLTEKGEMIVRHFLNLISH